jgi:hypothetical protein
MSGLDSIAIADRTVTNEISKLMAFKGLEYAKARLNRIYGDASPAERPHIDTCTKYIEDIERPQTTKLDKIDKTVPNIDSLPLKYQILIHHINFLGTAYIQHKNILPDIDTKLLNYWTDDVLKRLDRQGLQIDHAKLLALPTDWSRSIQKSVNATTKKEKLPEKKPKTLRVINNGIPHILKERFHKHIVCPSSSVCDAMGNFGSCAGAKRIEEFMGMSVKITSDVDSTDFYEVYSKIDGSKLEVISNSFSLCFDSQDPTQQVPTQQEMFIECRLSDIDLNNKPEMLSANNVFKETLKTIVIIMKEAQDVPQEVDALWGLLYRSDNFKKILKYLCQKATGDINQELNSIVKNGGYIPAEGSTKQKTDIDIINNINCLNVGLAGDRPSGVRMILLALYATNPREHLLSNFVVGYGNATNSLVVARPPPAAEVGVGGLARKGGSIRKTKFRKQKIMKTRKNKLYHHKMMSKRRKYNNKTKNRK